MSNDSAHPFVTIMPTARCFSSAAPEADSTEDANEGGE